MLDVEYRPRAALDIESIVIYIGEALASPKAAQETYQKTQDAVALIREMPTIGRRLADERFDGDGYRVYLVGQYKIAYCYDEERITVWRVVHAWRDIDDFALVEW